MTPRGKIIYEHLMKVNMEHTPMTQEELRDYPT